MMRFHLDYSMIRPGLGVLMLLAALLLLVLGGCAATPANSLTSHLNDEVRRLTMQCYWDNEGMRVVYGGMPVYTACRDWARGRVQVRLPTSAVALND